MSDEIASNFNNNIKNLKLYLKVFKNLYIFFNTFVFLLQMNLSTLMLNMVVKITRLPLFKLKKTSLNDI